MYTGDMLKKYLFIIAFSLCSVSFSQIRLPRLISDNMVLQRDTEVKVWGWASPGEKVMLRFNNKNYKAITTKEGKWKIILPPQKAGGPFNLDFSATNSITVKNVMFGDVWICTGQSNMVVNMERVKEKYPEDIASANFPQIRNLFIPTRAEMKGPVEDLPEGSMWKIATPEDVLKFGALTFFFARELHQRYNIPVGIINSSVGGTPVEAWIGEQGYNLFPEMIETINKNKDTARVNDINRKAALAAGRTVFKSSDKGMNEPVKWYDTAYQPKGWRNYYIPGYWEDQGLKDLNGVVWFRKEIELPPSAAGKPAKIFMGRIVDSDFMYVNGKQIGNITYQYPPRRYEVPAGLLKAGRNILVVRVTNNSGKGGFVPDKPYSLLIDGRETDLKGTWQYKVGEVFTPQMPAPGGINAQNQPSALYNAMIAPLTDYAAKGFIWYQGESNAGNPTNYDKLLTALIQNWRSDWKKPEAPFLYVQLPNYMDYNYLPGESSWAVLRDKQRQVLKVPHTAMVVATDCGEWNDIHPLNKKDVGLRLALAARKMAYNEDLVYSGPLFESASIVGDSVIISFTQLGGGLITIDGEPLRYFSIAGSDRKFVWAQAYIREDKVVVRSETVKQPVYVRYNWADNPEGNLYNREKLPASPFTTE